MIFIKPTSKQNRSFIFKNMPKCIFICLFKHFLKAPRVQFYLNKIGLIDNIRY